MASPNRCRPALTCSPSFIHTTHAILKWIVTLAFWSALLTISRGSKTPQHALPEFYARPVSVGDDSQQYIQDQKGAVTSENSICSKIGIDLLKDGGNAADAMVGTLLCVGVIGSHHSGIGGGGFTLVRDSHGSYEFIDFRESAPSAAFQDMYNNNSIASIRSGLASGVPGELRGLQYLHEKYGVLPWKEIVQPAVNVARYGWTITLDLARYMAAATAREDFLTNDPTWAIDFAPNGTRLGLGDVLTRKRYANTLETIAEEGADVFYTGAMARTTIQALRAANGTMTLEDLRDYQLAIRPPLTIHYRGFKVTSCGAPSSGGVALAVLKTVEGYSDFFAPETVNISTHRLDEAIRFGYGERANLGDPSFVDGLDQLQAEMLSSNTAAKIRSKIFDFKTQNVSAYDADGLESLETPGTSQVVTADASGMAISLTSTVNLFYGSHIIVPETGIIMNNEMNDFSIPGTSDAFGYVPSPANFVRAGKRPLSSITPVIVERPDGSLYYVTGAAGGSRILTSTIQNVIHMLDENMTILEGLAQPRLHDQLIPNLISFEYTYNNATVAFMQSLGHNVTWVPPGFSSAQSLLRTPNGTFEAAGDPRQVDSAGLAC